MIINKNGKLHAYNTDYLAALEYLSYYNNKSYKDWIEFFILGIGVFAAAVKAAANKLNMKFTSITRDNWSKLNNISSSLIYNCTPVENLQLDPSNIFIDCIVTTDTGHKLATMQASHQYTLYTGLKFPY